MAATNLCSVSTFGWWTDPDLVSNDELIQISTFGWYGDFVPVGGGGVCTSWQSMMVTGLRILLDDSDATSFTDGRLLDLITSSAIMVTQEVNFTTDYTITIHPPNISPDPTQDTQDDAFINLVLLKAACMADEQTIRSLSVLSGLTSRAGASRMKTSGNSFGVLVDSGYCATYNRLRNQYASQRKKNLKGTLSPFINGTFDPKNYR